jgi:tetratricopeptide (TPR) repeat protein
MKPRGFVESSIRTASFVAMILLPLTFLCWWLVWGLEEFRNGVIVISILFAASFIVIFGLIGGTLNQEKTLDVHFVRQIDFISDLEYSLSSLGFVLSDHGESYRQYQYRAQRVVVQLENNSATIIGTSGVLNNLNLPSVLYVNALEMVKQEKFQDAASLLEKVIKQKPEFEDAQIALLEVYSKIDGDDREYLKVKPITKKRMYLLWLDATKLYQIKQVLEKNEAVDVVMGDSSGEKEWNITREDFNWVANIYPIAEQGYAAGQQANFVQAIHYYKQALRMAPGCDLYLMSIGSAYAQLSNKDKAIQYLKRAAQISPGNSRIRENLLRIAGSETKGLLAKIEVVCPHCNQITQAVLPDSGEDRSNEPELQCKKCRKQFIFKVGTPYKPIGYV